MTETYGFLTAVTITVLCCAAVAEDRISANPSPEIPGSVTIDAAKGIEWLRKEQLLIARGDARAVRDALEVRAEAMTAHYRERPDGSVEVFQLDAEGNVLIASSSESSYSERAVYDLDNGLLTLSGGKQVGITTGANRITAEKEIEYDSKARVIVARGHAVAVDEGRTLYGDVITVHLRERVEGQSGIARIEANRVVRFVTPDEEIQADWGTYDAISGLATVSGSVKIFRGQNILNGCRGEVNVKTGVSTLLTCQDKGGGARVQGVILPGSLKGK
jgi:lipopolysaccharide export system protein LptA